MHNSHCNIIFVLSDRSVFEKNGKRAELKIQIMIFFFSCKMSVIIFMKLFSDILKRG